MSLPRAVAALDAATSGFILQKSAVRRCIQHRAAISAVLWQAPPFPTPSSCSTARHSWRQTRLCAVAAASSESDAEVVPSGSQDPFTKRLTEILRSKGASAAAIAAFNELGVYRGNEVAWQRVTELLCETAPGTAESMPHLRSMDMEELLRLVEVLAEEAGVTQASFWEKVAAATRSTFQSAEVSVDDAIKLTGFYANIGAWHKEVFQAALGKVAKDVMVHWMEPSQLAELLAIFGRAGAASREISGLATRLFNELEERVLEDGHKFEVEDCLSIVDSMARLATKENEVILRHFGRHRLHPELLEFSGQQIAGLCHSYGALGWKHDTVFKTVMQAVLEEQEKLQKARVLGLLSSVAMEDIKFRAPEIALVSEALVCLRMYRGNNEWFRWGENYEQLLDVLERRLESGGELDTMPARSLAAAAYALGRDRRGSEDLCTALLNRMTKLLELGESVPEGQPSTRFREAPQEHLERFMHGIAMMGPSKRKEFLDTQWLREWMCSNYYTLSLGHLIRVNRYLVQVRSFDQPYLETFVPLYIEPDTMSQLKKSDIMELTHTYNGAKMGDEDLGRHFFWALGRQFQKQNIAGLALASRKRRPNVQRLG